MMKKLIISLGIFAVLGLGYFAYSSGQNTKSTETIETQLIPPTRPAEVTGSMISVEGNEVIVAKELGRVVLSEEEQAVKKAQMQKLSEDQRKAAREEENQQYKTENTTLTIPVGVPITQGTGDGSGDIRLVDLASLTKGTYVSIWITTNGIVEYVKIKGI